MTKNKLTVKEILNCKGCNKLTEVYTHNPLEAESCELAGIELIVSSERNDIQGIRQAAKNTFFTVGLQYGKYLSELEILNRCFDLYENGADAIYCPQSYKFIKAIADEGIPVVGHTGFIPYKSTFYGGFKAYGKNALEAKKIYEQTLKLQDAGAFAVEIEIVPYKVADYISKNVEVFMIGMGSGVGCDAQYLFSEDVLGYNKGHIPRHAKVYSNLAKDFEKIKLKSIEAYKSFKDDVISSNYPEKKHDLNIPKEEYEKFIKNIDS
ncbi:MAG: 3-methyl-2-oxobutanoate hydroxymethyltransferase [Alphaproteobacteria bacterium MarineAlpha5_Bin5]|nr:MAG: 3-methyl-2-oxobutanoate hydroxymethyltransferase [Alphaproteobacteria bacterium MarineAlpha5_Bin4]PPR50413.1 MAG: 3-methyl-2-oxobutanoate hydroxymethyltransferase [Alphaproteobacteria bacterium MarineAlpha5_Bin5]|tara:strand:+ start:380 stop:1174 length:795 start_codon:yes stop_codon:yes gene_type:complete